MKLLKFFKIQKSKFESYLDSITSLDDRLKAASVDCEEKIKVMENQTADVIARKREFDDSMKNLGFEVAAMLSALKAKKSAGATEEELAVEIQTYLSVKETYDSVKAQATTFDDKIEKAKDALYNAYRKRDAMAAKKAALATQIKILELSKTTFDSVPGFEMDFSKTFDEVEQLLKSETNVMEAKAEVEKIKQSATAPKVASVNESVSDIYNSL